MSLLPHSTSARCAVLAVGGLAAAVLAGCAQPGVQAPPLREQVVAITAGHEIITFNAARPGDILERKPLQGLPADEKLVGIDFRVARGVLYALSQAGRLYTLDLGSGRLAPVGAGAPPAALKGTAFGVDFNPAADRIRVVSNLGQNLRLHPDTGAVVDGDALQPGVQADPFLRYAWSDVNHARSPEVVAAGYTYNASNDKLTTNYAIDRALGVLVMQGSREGETPVVSPNTGQLRTVGALGLGPLADATLDISDVDNTALAAVRTPGDPKTRLHLIDLRTGKALPLGIVGDGSPLVGMAIEP
jgi:hypothetical protein